MGEISIGVLKIQHPTLCTQLLSNSNFNVDDVNRRSSILNFKSCQWYFVVDTFISHGMEHARPPLGLADFLLGHMQGLFHSPNGICGIEEIDD